MTPATRSPAIPCKICQEGRGRHPVYSSQADRAHGRAEGYLCNECADDAPTSMVEITPDGEEAPRRTVPGGGRVHVEWRDPARINVNITVDTQAFIEAFDQEVNGLLTMMATETEAISTAGEEGQ